MSIKKKLTLITLMVVSVFCLVFGAVACNGSAKQAVEMYLLPQAQTLVSEDFSLPKKIGKNDSVTVEWKSSNTNAISIEDAGDKYTAKVTLQDEVTDVTLTISAGGASKDFVVRVDELTVYTFLDRYEFPQMNTAQKSDFDLDTEMTVQGKKATITWSIDSQYAEFIALNAERNRVLVSPVEDIKSVKIKATFSYGEDKASQDYPFSVAPPLEHRQLVNRMYSVEGYPIEFSGYVVHVYSKGEDYGGNATFYAIDDDFCSGYYIYQAGVSTDQLDKVVEGAHFTFSGDKTKNYSGLWETVGKEAGKAVFDDKDPIDPREHIYALDTDLLAGAPSLLWRESTLVSLSGWKITKKESSKPTTKAANMFTISRDGVSIAIRYTTYINRTEDETKALLDVYDNFEEGDFVNVTGILGCYNTAGGFDVSKFQLQPILAGDITKATAEGTNTDGAKVKAAIAKVNAAVQTNFGGLVTTDKDFTMPTSEGDVTISYRVAGENLQDPTVTINGGKISVKPDATEKNYDIEVTYSIGNYKAYGFFKIQNWKKSNAELVETVKEALQKLNLATVTAVGQVTFPTPEETYGANITWELGENPPTWITSANGKITVNALPAEETKVKVVANIELGEAKDSVELTLTVAAAPTEVFKALEEPVAGTYKLAMDKNGTMLYFNGEMSGYYYGTVTDVASAADVVLAGSATDGWTLKTGNKFLEIEYAKGNDNNYHANVKLNDAQTAGKTWKWNTTNKVFTWTVDVNGTPTEYFLGTSSTANYTTISANEIDKISTYCVAKLGNMSGTQPQPSGDFILTGEKLKTALAGKTGYQTGTYTVDGVSVEIASVMPNDAYYDGTEHPYGFTVIQFKKTEGTLSLKGTFSKVSVVVASSYAYSDTWLTLTAGSTALSVSNHTEEDANFSVGSNAWKFYTIEYAVTTTGEQTITIKAGSYAIYVKSITLTGTASQGGTVDPDPQPTDPGIKDENGTITFNVGNYAAAQKWENATRYEEVALGENVTVTATGTAVGEHGLNTGKYYTSNKSWRIYQNEKCNLTFTAKTGYEIVSIKITYKGDKNGVLVSGETQYPSGNVITVNSATATFTVAQTTVTADANGNVQITEIEVVYKTSGGSVEPQPQPTGSLELTSESFSVLDSTKTGYEQYAGVHTVNGYQVTLSDVMSGSEASYKVVQFKKNSGTLTLTGTFTKITVVLVSTNEYGEDYILTITAGTTKLTPSLKKTEEIGKKDGQLDVKIYTIEYTVTTTGPQEFTLKAGSKATYASSILFDDGTATTPEPEPDKNDGSQEKPYSVAEALEACRALAIDAYSATAVYVTGYVIDVGSWSDQYNDWSRVYIGDAAGDAKNAGLQIFALYPDDTYLKLPNDLAKGMKITVYGYLQNYKGNSSSATLEMTAHSNVNVQAVSYADTRTIAEKVTAALNAVALPSTVTENFALPKSTVTGVTLAFVSGNTAAITVGEQEFTVVLGATDVSVEITITASAQGTDAQTKKVTVIVRSATTKSVSLSFANKNSRTSYSTTSQVWGQNDITFTNNKSGSNNNVYDGANPVRCYQNSSIKVEFTSAMKEIVFHCNSASYASALKNSITAAEGVTVTLSGSDVSVAFATPQKVFEIASLGAQVRINSIDVVYDAPAAATVNVAPVALLPGKEF